MVMVLWLRILLGFFSLLGWLLGFGHFFIGVGLGRCADLRRFLDLLRLLLSFLNSLLFLGQLSRLDLHFLDPFEFLFFPDFLLFLQFFHFCFGHFFRFFDIFGVDILHLGNFL